MSFKKLGLDLDRKISQAAHICLWEHVFIVKVSSDILVSTKCKVIFAAASFRNSAAQFCLRGVLTLVSCPIVLSTYMSTSPCLKQFCESVFSPLTLLWTLIILKL